MKTCDGCKGEFQDWEIVDSSDDKYGFCLNCTYKYDADMDAMTDE
jgi:hypothetical protein